MTSTRDYRVNKHQVNTVWLSHGLSRVYDKRGRGILNILKSRVLRNVNPKLFFFILQYEVPSRHIVFHLYRYRVSIRKHSVMPLCLAKTIYTSADRLIALLIPAVSCLLFFCCCSCTFYD